MAAGRQLSVRGRFWLRHLGRWEASGLSQAQYCREHKLSVAAFGWWKGQLSRGRKRRHSGTTTHKATAQKGTFVEVALASSDRTEASDSAVYEIALAHDRCLRLGRGFESERVRQLLALLEERC
jgi:hypothetical protein